MSDRPEKRPITAKKLVLVIVIAVVMAVVVTLAQTLIMGRANIAVTGGIVGAITAFLFTTQISRKTD